jgi:membrane protease YdiL (CAAX protease family)
MDKHSAGGQPSDTEFPAINWNPWLGVLFVVIVFYASQILAGLAVSIYPWLQHWTASQTTSWLRDSVGAQFIYIALAETLAIAALWRFLKLYRSNFAAIGLLRPRWRDIGFGLASVPVYYVIYLMTVGLVSHFVSSFDAQQAQEIGFENVAGALPFILTFISLVIIPPIAEEIIVRGFLYSSLKKAMRLIPAALLTSAIFAAAHLPEGGAAGPLYVAALDTFVLSLVLIYLREKTDSLWASITLHTFKNGVAFVALFVFHL